MSEGAVLADGSTGNVLLDLVLVRQRAVGEADPGPDHTVLLELVQLERDQVVHEPGTPIEHVYFPRSTVFGLMVVTDGAPPVEAMAVGPEGVVGLAAVLGDGTSPHQALCQVPGQALRLPVEALRDLAEVDAAVRRLLGQHAQTAVILLSQRVACSQRHTAQQRCADWLLRHADWGWPDPIPVTQRFLAAMLGLRRTTVSAIAAQLQSTRLIAYRYGRLVVQDHAGLEQLACDCYRISRLQYQKLHVAATSKSTDEV